MVHHYFKITNLIEKASADYICRISGDGPFLARVDNHEIKIELINGIGRLGASETLLGISAFSAKAENP